MLKITSLLPSFVIAKNCDNALLEKFKIIAPSFVLLVFLYDTVRLNSRVKEKVTSFTE
jgi:hypothetical protein